MDTMAEKARLMKYSSKGELADRLLFAYRTIQTLEAKIEIDNLKPIEQEKDDWTGAPGWANYIATDADGMVYYYGRMPDLDETRGLWINGHRVTTKGLVLDMTTVDWKISLKKRSERTKK